MHDDLNRLCALVQKHCPAGLVETALEGVRLNQTTAPTMPSSGVYEPMLCIILQGAKLVTIGDRTIRYDPASYFVASVELPATGWICEASAERPYVAMSMTIDRQMLASVLADMPVQAEGSDGGFFVNALTPGLLGSMSRLVELLDRPEDVPVLAPMIRREILYRLLQSDHSGTLQQIARADSRISRIHRTLHWIRDHYDEPLSIDAMSELAGMSRASFHRHFKAVTAMSPLQYQKALRLQEARRILVAQTDAQGTAHRVGYESASQFSREYARMFGMPPTRDAERLRGSPQPADL
ncbi:MAG TPA: AraC family transcriptional regulator [Sphingobium sp.]|uniref:AraC family transcriptional regulator n=1 Tax=Sphingobium sp. TaxID=1912891 RepID=UPI002ED33C30